MAWPLCESAEVVLSFQVQQVGLDFGVLSLCDGFVGVTFEVEVSQLVKRGFGELDLVPGLLDPRSGI